jgi:DNA invertase Pin-like site-specific DNA recombinase
MSTPNQLKGDSLRRQVAASKLYAAEHGLTLDDSLQLQDLGISAFKGDNAVTGALSRFLSAIDSGSVAPGSTLLVESLDRLSRQRVAAAMTLFLNIVERGVTIVTLADGNVYQPGSSDPMPLIQSLLIMSRAHEESKIKSQRVSAAWENKRNGLGHKKLTARCPLWLSLSSDASSFDINEERAEIVRTIYKLAANGHGHYSICKRLNGHGVTPFGRSKGWGESYVEKILHNRAVIGEFQPHHLVNGKRVPWGEPIPSYFPAVVEEDMFLAVQAARRARATGSGGRRGENHANLFTHIAKCGHCGASMRMVNKGKPPKGGRYLRCSNALTGLGCTAPSWRYEAFETTFLTFCSEIDLASLHADARTDVANAKHQYARELERLAIAEARREKIFSLIDMMADVQFISDKLDACLAEIAQIKTEIERLSAEAHSSSLVEPGELGEHITALRDATNAEMLDARVRLASRLKGIVKSLRISASGYLGPVLFDGLDEYEGLNARLLHDQAVAGVPAFAVEFTTGMKRHISVLPDDPLEVARIFEVPLKRGPWVLWGSEFPHDEDNVPPYADD